LSPPAHSCAITSDCNRREGKPKLSASWVGLRMIVTFHQLGTADEGRTQIARGLPKGGSRIRAAGPSRPPDIVAQDSNIIRIVLAQAGARCGRTCGRDSKCAHSLNSQYRALSRSLILAHALSMRVAHPDARFLPELRPLGFESGGFFPLWARNREHRGIAVTLRTIEEPSQLPLPSCVRGGWYPLSPISGHLPADSMPPPQSQGGRDAFLTRHPSQARA
jgi:hypothetical protein